MKFGKIFAGVVVLIAGIMAISAFASAITVEMHEGMVSSGSKYMAVAYGNGTYVEVWYNVTGAYMNATAIDASSGLIVKNATLATDIYTYTSTYSGTMPVVRPAIAYDPVDKEFMVAWVNSSKALEVEIIDSNLNIMDGPFAVNETGGVDTYTGISLAYGNGTFLAVWGNGVTSRLQGRFMMMNDTVSYESNVFNMTSYTGSVYQNYPWIGYDSTSKRFMVTWVNVTANATSKFYNITGKIIGMNNGALVNYTGDMMLGDAYDMGASFSAPAVAGGDNHFMVTYVSYNSPYDIYAKIYDANGTLVNNMTVNQTNQYNNKAPMPAVFNGSAFVMVWSNSSQYIVSQAFCPNGTAATSMKVLYNGTGGGNPMVAYDPDNNTYMFAWTEYGRATSYGLAYVVLTSNEYAVPEFNWAMPLLLTIMVGSVVLVRRKH